MGRIEVEVIQTDGQSVGAASRIPLWVKLVYTAFVGVLVPYYWSTYGPTNFLYFCAHAFPVEKDVPARNEVK